MAELIRGIIFDLDGVIVDSHPAHERAWQALLEEQCRSVPPADVSAIIRQGKTRAEIVKSLFPDMPAAHQVTLGNRKNEIYLENREHVRAIPDVISWIAQLSRMAMPMAVATSASRPRALATLAQFKLMPYFDFVVTSSEIEAGKPDPALFLAAAAALALHPAETLVIEDSPAGLEAAMAAGMQTLLYCPSPCDPEMLALPPDFVAHDFSPQSLALVMSLLASRTPVEASL